MNTVNYTTVTEGFDWGPAVTKVIIEVGESLDLSSLMENTFHISSVREFYEVDYPSMKRKEKPTVQTTERKIIQAYGSDEEGNRDQNGTYITFELEVGPEVSAGAPFYYDMAAGHNMYAATKYQFELSPDSQLMTANGKKVVLKVKEYGVFQGNNNIIADDFDRTGSYIMGDITLTYASFIPENASADTGSNPLIIWLHGAGEGGEDPMITLYGNKVVSLADREIQKYFGDTGAYILVPQCKTIWMDYDGSNTYNITVNGSNGKSYYTEALMGLIQEYVTKHPEVNPNRIYLGGCSNGGYMTMNMLITYPDYFAGAFPICEAYSNTWLTDEKLEAIKDIPIWFTHAKTDGTVAIYQGNFDRSAMSYQLATDEKGDFIPIDDFTNAAYRRLLEAGAENVHYTLWDKVEDTTGKYFKAQDKVQPYEYNGHYSWVYALNNECTDTIDGKKITLFKWLSEQKKEKKPDLN